MLSKVAKRNIFLCIFCAICAIVFPVLHYYKVISTLDLYMSAIYLSYFVGIALLFNGAYSRERQRLGASLTTILMGFFFVAASVAMLVYGLCSGMIIFF